MKPTTKYKKQDRSGVTGIGPRIRKWRKKIPMKAYQLAKLIKISPGSLSDIENNQSDPSASTIVKLLTLTDIDWRWLLTGKFGDIPKGETDAKPAPLIIHVEPGSELLIVGRSTR